MHSGLQKEVLGLYRQCLRAVRTKPKENQANFTLYIKTQFRQQARSVTSKDFTAIEYLIRQGKRKMEQLKNPNLTNIS